MANVHDYNVEELLGASTTTKRQKEVLKVLDEVGTIAATAKVLGINKRSTQQILAKAKKKFMASKVDELVPDGQELKGTTTLYKINEDTGVKEEVLQWVKTNTDKERTLEMVQKYTEKLVKGVIPVEPIECTEEVEKDLMVTYVNTDLHLGQYSWDRESGTNVNAQTVYDNTIKANRILLGTTPKAETAIVLDLGDTLHAGNDANRTKSGHELDVDTRHAKIFEMLVDMKITMINNALQKHAKVRYVVVAGNHSDLVGCYLTALLKAYYRNEPRFEVDESPALHKYYRFGKTLLGFHHGHATKMARLPEVMVWDRKEDISDTDYRYWLTGHVHKDSLMDSSIARCESFRNATPNDAWATGAGYRGLKQTTAITYHNKFGEIARHVCPINMV